MKRLGTPLAPSHQGCVLVGALSLFPQGVRGRAQPLVFTAVSGSLLNSGIQIEVASELQYQLGSKCLQSLILYLSGLPRLPGLLHG